VQRQINVVDTFSITKGNHQLKFGADYRRLNPIQDRTRYSLQGSFHQRHHGRHNRTGFTRSGIRFFRTALAYLQQPLFICSGQLEG
jgi:hypothetical protein